MKRDERGFIVFDSVREENEWMQQWMADHPGPWHRCPTCLSWSLRKAKPRPGSRCPQCDPIDRQEEMPTRKEHMRGSRDRREWGHYAD